MIGAAPSRGSWMRATLLAVLWLSAAGSAAISLAPGVAWAQEASAGAAPALDSSAPGPSITGSLPGASDHGGRSSAFRILVLLTVLSIAPGILISVTSFTRIVVVLSFVRQGIGTQSAPPTQVLLALALVLTGVVMGPVLMRVNDDALTPYMEDRIEGDQAYELAAAEIRTFLLRHTRETDLLLFYDVSHVPRPETEQDVELRLLVPAFMISELQTAFQMGFLIFLPFVLIDLLAASILSAMGMVMMPPTMISTPLKLLLFVAVDGWALLVHALVASYG